MTSENNPGRRMPEQRVLRDIAPGNFYVGSDTKIEAEFPNQQRILALEEGAFPFPPTERIQAILDEINASGELLSSILEYGSVSDEPFKKNVRELLEIGDQDKVYIVGSGGGR